MKFVSAIVVTWALILSPLSSAANPIDFATELTAENVYSLLRSGNPEPYSQWVKFTIVFPESGDWRTAAWDQVYFQNSTRYAFHADFLTTRPEFLGLSRAAIDAVTYQGAKRRALTGTLLLQFGLGEGVAFELMTAEILPPELVQKAKLAVLNHAKKLNDVGYLPLPAHREHVARDHDAYVKLGVTIVLPASKDVECYSAGWGTGTVTPLSPAEFETRLKQGAIGPQDILVLDEAPRELPPVAGVVISQSSSPSSHLALLGAMYGFPVIYERDAIRKPEWQALAGQPVFLKVLDNGGCQVELEAGLRSGDMSRLMRLKQPMPLGAPRVDLSAKAIVSIDRLSPADVARYGGKAANFSRFARALPAPAYPRGIAVPVHAYAEFLRLAKAPDGGSLRAWINAQLAAIHEAPPTQALPVLKKIRDAIKSAPVPASVLSPIRKAIAQTYPDSHQRIRIRSSSNVEDLKNFNGAGLYDSAGACPGDVSLAAKKSVCRSDDSPDPIEGALKKVWRSVFNDRAYLARRWYGIDETAVAMGLLIHPGTDGELANGVAIVRSSGPRNFSAKITGFPGEDLQVTHPPIGMSPETVEVSTPYGGADDGNWSTKVLVSCSEIGRGRTLLTEAQYLELAGHFAKVLRAWSPTSASTDVALDFEWKLSPDGRVMVKQVREVPRSSDSLPLNEETYFVGGDVELHSSFGEQPFGLERLLLGNFKLRLKAELFSTADVQTGRSIPANATVVTRDGEFTVSSRDIRFTVTDTTWAPRWDGKSETRERTLTIKLPIPSYPSLRWVMRFSETRARAGTSLQDPIAVLGSGFGGFVVDQDNLSRPTQNGRPLEWSTYDPQRAQRTEEPPFDASETFVSPTIAVTATSTTTCTGFCKTTFRELSRVEITGLASAPIVVTEASGMTYAPAHHNFSFEYAIDLSLAQGPSKSELDALIAQYGRYITFGTRDWGPIVLTGWTLTGTPTQITELKAPQARQPGENVQPPRFGF